LQTWLEVLMADKHKQARSLAEEGLDTILEGDRKKGEAMVKKAKSLDPNAAVEVGEEAEAEKKRGERFLQQSGNERGSAKDK
jgi:uncharacterized protein HemY